MRRSLQKTVYILVLFLVLPVVGYSVFEYSQLDKNEKVLEDIYNKQLETILFSVNQYADDMINTWARKITSAYIQKDENTLKSTLQNTGAIKYLFISDSILRNKPLVISPDSQFLATPAMLDSLSKMLISKKELIDRLFNYFQAGYQKMEPLLIKNNEVIVVFVDKNDGQKSVIYGFALDAHKFIALHLGPRISGIVGDDFIVSIRDSVSRKILFSSSRNDSISESYSKSLWLIPKYKLIIGSKGISVNDIVARRTKMNFIILIVLAFVLLIGVLMVFLNIRKEIRLAQIKSEFVSNVSHEIRTPLAIIKLYTETLLMQRVSPEKTEKYFNILNQEASRLTNLVNRILSFSQIESQKKKYNFTDVDISKLMLQIKETYQFHLQSKGFASDFEIDENLPSIQGDSEAITEMVVNLIDNAIKYSKEEKYILLKAYKNGNEVNIEVHDRGIGIATKHQKQIFEEFFRVPSNLVHNTKGTGLGLSIVKHTMDEHKGEILVTSTPGSGSCFRLRFPVI